jgi:putative ATPase
MKEWGYGTGYQHAHQFEDALNTMECLPENLRGTVFYKPTRRGLEQRIEERLQEIRQRRRESKPESKPELPRKDDGSGTTG